MYGVMDKVICFDICRILSLCGTTVVTSTKKVLCHIFKFLHIPKDNDVNNSESQNSAIHRVSLNIRVFQKQQLLHLCCPCQPYL
jgi:hypothetical protein